jgi:hypothetical protein
MGKIYAKSLRVPLSLTMHQFSAIAPVWAFAMQFIYLYIFNHMIRMGILSGAWLANASL